MAFFIFIWRNRNFNELFDGIIYASYISLGFAAVENIFMYSDMDMELEL
ncbi:MAG: PrsW family intramembrane metalloprotease [Chloroflexia bacterium]|nr:PrsW family intramembrane metalloprotease [Chloroflexia bacterium]